MSTINIFTWNVNGIRAIQKKNFIDWFNLCNGDIICLQETKASIDQIPPELTNIKGYQSFFFSAKRKGYSGVATYTRLKPENVTYGFNNEKFDEEGRVIFTEYKTFLLANVYFPNGGRGAERVSYKLEFYNELFFYLFKYYQGKKGIIVAGDFNTAHKEIDLARPKENSTVSGFLPEERKWIDKIINLGYVDVFRIFHPEPGWYSYWDPVTRARERNIGWRIDYFMVSKDFVPNVIDASIHPEVMGSDHCPVSIKIKV